MRAQAQGLLRQQERRLRRCEGRVRLRMQVQRREQALARFDERGLVRGPVTGLELASLQRQVRLLLPVLKRRLLRMQERGPFRGQGLPQRYGG